MMSYSRNMRKRKSGQTLILAIMILVVILAAILIFFDIHNAVRAKVKAQNAVDAAALAGANWQMHTLNLIGELNLVKAADVMISEDSLGIGRNPGKFMEQESPFELWTPEKLKKNIEKVEREKAQLKTALDLVTEMQTRISFVGPLIGFGAAQQAAKNNGLNYNNASGKLIYEILYQNILNDDVYGNETLAPQLINGYSWRIPYGSMIGDILDVRDVDGDQTFLGVAAFPRFTSLGLMDISASGSSPFTRFIMQRDFYDAVAGNNWCAIMDFLDLSKENDMNGAWWGKYANAYASSFLKQSEILPAHVTYLTGGSLFDSAPTEVTERYMKNRELRSLNSRYDKEVPYEYEISSTGEIIYKGEYDDKTGWPVRNEKDTDLKIVLPEITWAVFDDTWQDYSDTKKDQWEDYLNGTFQPGSDYSGAVSYFEAGFPMKTYKWTGHTTKSFHDAGGSKDDTAWKIRKYGKNAASYGDKLKSMSTHISVSSSAKPIGSLSVSGKALSPLGASGLILPVFSHSVLIPVSLDPPDGYSLLDIAWVYFASEFLPILGQCESLSDAMAQAQLAHPDHVDYYTYFYDVLEKMNDPAWRQEGIDWLDTPIEYYRDKNGVEYVKTRNRDKCNYWPEGPGGGNRWGPSVLH